MSATESTVTVPTLFLLGKSAKRTKSVLFQADLGDYHSGSISPVSLRAGWFKLTRELLGSASNFRPALTLTQYADEFGPLLGVDNKKIETGIHVTPVFGFIGEQSPKSALVYAQLLDTNLLGKSVICEKDFDRVRDFSVRSGQSLREQIIANKVSVINMSAGHSREPAERMLAATCPGVQFSYEDVTQYLLSVRPYYELISSIDGVTFVQAGEAHDSANQANADYSPIDCAPKESMPNRIRVGLLDFSEDPKIPKGEAGKYSDFVDRLSLGSQISVGCFDVFVNLGATELNPREISSTFYFTDGFSVMSSWMVPATSWAAPVMTTHLMYLNSLARKLSPKEILSRITVDSMPGILDPLWNNETPYQNENLSSGQRRYDY